MEKILAPIKERILVYLENKGIEKKYFFGKIAVAPSNFRSSAMKSEVGGDVIAKILSFDQTLNATWLLTGEGPMFKNTDTLRLADAGQANKLYEELYPDQIEGYTALHEESEVYQTPTKTERKPIPLVSVSVVGGMGSGAFAIHERDVKAMYVVPKFEHKHVDFMIEVEGGSMYPKYSSGDVVACKKIELNSFIQWNKCHVVATRDQGIIIKRIKKGSTDLFLCMHSDNKDYEPFEVPREEITGIALVVGVIRLE